MILSNYKETLDKIFEKLKDLGINANDFEIDHIGYQADSKKDYNLRTSEISDHSEMISEKIVGGRTVGIFKLNEPLNYGHESIQVIEIFEPREGQSVVSAWEHIELLSEQTLEEIVSKYQQISWDTSALNRDEFPMLITSLEDGLRAKFPRLGVLDEVRRIEKS